MNIQPFEFCGCTVRSFEENGVAWFVARDVAVFLKYERPRDAVSAHCKGAVKRRIPTPGGEQEMTVIPERDVYRLVMRSKMPKAEEFEEFIMGTVVPQVVRTGRYVPEELTRLEIIELARDAEIGRLKEKERRIAAEHQVALAAPKVEFVNKYVNVKSEMTVSKASKVLGFGRNRFFAGLVEMGILMKNNNPYQRYIESGYFAVKTSIVNKGQRIGDVPYCQTFVTPKGLLWLSEKVEEIRAAIVRAKNKAA